jgi:hypothetical protein
MYLWVNHHREAVVVLGFEPVVVLEPLRPKPEHDALHLGQQHYSIRPNCWGLTSAAVDLLEEFLQQGLTSAVIGDGTSMVKVLWELIDKMQCPKTSGLNNGLPA